jgi:hypothetical protein
MHRTDNNTYRELKEEILDAISKSKGTKTTFLHAERIDQAVGRAYGMDASDESNSTEQDSACNVSVLAIDQGNSQASVATSLSLSVLSDGPGGEGKGAGDDDDLVNSQLQQLNVPQFDLLQTISDDSFMKIAAHIQLQKSVSAFASVVMEGRPTEHSRPPTSTGAEPTPWSETNSTPHLGGSPDSKRVVHSKSSASSMSSEPGSMDPGVRSTAGSQRGGSGNDAQLPAANDEQFRSFKQDYPPSTSGTDPSDGGPESSTAGNPGTPPTAPRQKGSDVQHTNISHRTLMTTGTNLFRSLTTQVPPHQFRSAPVMSSLDRSLPAIRSLALCEPPATPAPPPPPKYRYSEPSGWTEPRVRRIRGTVEAEIAGRRLEELREEQAKKKALERHKEHEANMREEVEALRRHHLHNRKLARERTVVGIEKAKVEAEQAAR